MKKFVTIVLSVLMTINFAGCTFGTKPVATPSKDNVAKAETKATLAVEKEETAEDEKTEEKGVYDDWEKEDTDKEEKKTEDDSKENTKSDIDTNVQAIGIKSDMGYKNPYFGLEITVPAGSTIMSDDEIKDLMGQTTDLIGNDDLTDYLEEGNIWIDYNFSTKNNESNFSVGIEKLTTNRSTVEERIDKSIADGSYEEIYETVGFEDVKAEKTTINVGEDEIPAILLSIPVSEDRVLYEIQTMVIKDDYMITFTSTSFSLDSINDLFKNISKTSADDSEFF